MVRIFFAHLIVSVLLAKEINQDQEKAYYDRRVLLG